MDGLISQARHVYRVDACRLWMDQKSIIATRFVNVIIEAIVSYNTLSPGADTITYPCREIYPATISTVSTLMPIGSGSNPFPIIEIGPVPPKPWNQQASDTSYM
jgi:hypothetical protein